MKIVLLCLLLAVIIHADDPKLKIFAAFWGDRDVTTDIVQKIEDNSVRVDATDTVFGDPWVGNIKTLSVFYYYGSSKLFVEVVLEGQSMLIKYFPQIHLGSAYRPPCPAILRAVFGNKEVSMKALEYALINGNVVPGTDTVFGDNMVGILKTFAMVFYDRNCNLLPKVVKEGGMININQ